MCIPKICYILRELLHIDQELHVRKGIQLTFREWLELNKIDFLKMLF
jgi:hypothetical protein